jgi:hypothetical protein
MKFKTDDSYGDGSSKQGDLSGMTYKELVSIFGKENSDGDGYKVQACWGIEFEDGTIASIYDYKEGKKYNGKSGTPKTKVTAWNIGGYNSMAVVRVMETIEEHRNV